MSSKDREIEDYRKLISSQEEEIDNLKLQLESLTQTVSKTRDNMVSFGEHKFSMPRDTELLNMTHCEYQTTCYVKGSKLYVPTNGFSRWSNLAQTDSHVDGYELFVKSGGGISDDLKSKSSYHNDNTKVSGLIHKNKILLSNKRKKVKQIIANFDGDEFPVKLEENA